MVFEALPLKTEEFTPLPLGAENKTAGFQPLPVSSAETGVDAFEPLPVQSTQEPDRQIAPIEELPFKAKHPNLYGIGGAIKETGKELSKVAWFKYLYPEERKKFSELAGDPTSDSLWTPKTKKQAQIRDLLYQDLEFVTLAQFGKLTKDAKHVFSAPFKKYFPKAFERVSAFMTKPRLAGKVAETAVKGADEAVAPIVAGEVVGEELPKHAASVNLERQAIDKKLKLTELRAAEEVPKTKLTWAETDAKSAEILKNPTGTAKVLEKAKQGKALNVIETDVVRKANIEGVYQFQREMQNAKTGADAQALFDHYVESTFKPAAEAATEAGRVLQSYNKEIGLNRIGKAFSKLKKGLSDRELKEFQELDLNNPDQVKGFINRLGDPKLMDYVYEFWYNGILSGVPTHVVNVASNTAWMAFQVPHRILTGGVDKIVSTLTGAARTRYMNEAIPMMGGVVTGAKRGAKGAVDILRHGKIQEFETKWAQEVGAALGAFDRSPNKAVREVGKYITFPTKALRAMDVWGNSIAYDAQVQALARRASSLKGLKGITKKKFEEAFLKNTPKAAHEEAMEFAKYATFMSDPGFFSSAVIKLRGQIPGFRFVVPFVNTIGNLLKRGVEMTPGAGLALTKGQNPSEVIAKQIEGAIISMYVLTKAEAGELTGGAPTSPTEREAFYRQGKKAWSIRIGKEWYQYRRVEPFNTVIASAAIAHDRIKNAKDDEDAFDIFSNVASDFKNNLIDSAYLQSVSQLLNRHGKIQEFPKRTAPSLLVPFSGFFRSINRAHEAATEGSAKIRDTSTWIGAFSTVIPGLSGEVPAKLNAWGEEIELEGGMLRQWIPYKWSTETKDLTEISLEKLGVYPGHPSQNIKIKGKDAKLDDDIYKDYLIAYGHKAKQYLDKYFAKPHIQKAMEKDDKKEIVAEITNSILSSLRSPYRNRAIREQLKRNSQKK